MYSDDSLDEYDADNVEYLNEFDDSPLGSFSNRSLSDSSIQIWGERHLGFSLWKLLLESPISSPSIQGLEDFNSFNQLHNIIDDSSNNNNSNFNSKQFNATMTSSKQFSTKPTTNSTINKNKSTTKNNNITKQFNNSSKQFTEYQKQQHGKQQKVQVAVNNKRLNANTRPNTRIIGEPTEIS